MVAKRLVLVVVMAMVLGSALAFTAYTMYYTEYAVIYDMNITVGDHVGFDVDNETLAFGMVMSGSTSSTRFILLGNDMDYPLRVEFKASGEFADWIDINNEQTILEAHETRKVPVSATAPSDAELGDYRGKMRIIFKKV